jgi:hypothetical protein
MTGLMPRAINEKYASENATFAQLTMYEWYFSAFFLFISFFISHPRGKRL